MTTPIKITKFSIENFLGIRFYKVDALGNLVMIKGGNGAGKSSVIKAIRETIKSTGTDPDLVMTGADKAEILINFSNHLELRRLITKKKNELTATIDGKPVDKPTVYLQALLGSDGIFNFDPIRFFKADGVEGDRQRREMILKAVPFKIDKAKLTEMIGADKIAKLKLNLDKYNYDLHGLVLLAKVAKDVYDNRHEVNVGLETLKRSILQERKEVEGLGNVGDWEGFDLQAAIEAQTALESRQRNFDAMNKRLETLRDAALSSKHRIESLDSQIKSLQEQKAAEEQRLGKIQAEGMTLKNEIGDQVVDLSAEIQKHKDKIAGYEKHRNVVSRFEAIARREAEAEDIAKHHTFLDGEYDRLKDVLPQQIMKDLQLDKIYGGLTISEDDIRVDGRPLLKLSKSEQLKFAVRMARALSGPVKAICIDDFEGLSQSNRKAFLEEIQGDDFEYFIAEVTDGPLDVETDGNNGSGQTKAEPKPKANVAATSEAGF